MRAVIPFKQTSGAAVELRYAIRSLVKHCQDLTGVLLIGDCPDWFTGDHIPATDLPNQKERNMMRKVRLCPDFLFLYTNDDFFALTDFYSGTLPDYYDMTCGEMAIRHKSPTYKRMYEACPADWLNYDVHAPMMMECGRFDALYRLMDEVMPIKTMYQQGKSTGLNLHMVDSKIRGIHTRAELNFHIIGRDFFSTHNSAVDKTLIKFLNDLYPDASPFEK